MSVSWPIKCQYSDQSDTFKTRDMNHFLMENDSRARVQGGRSVEKLRFNEGPRMGHSRG